MTWKDYYRKKGDYKQYLKIKRGWAHRWRERTGSFKYKKRKWTEYEDSLVLAHDCSDRELSEEICRSVQAIHTRRSKLKTMGVD